MKTPWGRKRRARKALDQARPYPEYVPDINTQSALSEYFRTKNFQIGKNREIDYLYNRLASTTFRPIEVTMDRDRSSWQVTVFTSGNDHRFTSSGASREDLRALLHVAIRSTLGEPDGSDPSQDPLLI